MLLAAASVGFVVAPAASVRATPATGIELLSESRLTPRLIELQLDSPALGHATGVRVLVPDGFDPGRDHLPVLWLLHGGFGTFRDWTDVGNAEALTAGLPLIVVMPDGGTGGWYSDWRSATPEGPQGWETYHLDELRPFIEARYQTRTDRSGRAIAGLSMGGFGAMHDAARRPDLFGFAASFSGAVDVLHPGVAAVVLASPLAHQGLPGAIFGDPVTNETTWRANNPVDLAANLATVETQLRTGNGLPGGAHGGGPDIQEVGVSGATATLHQRLDALAIPHLYDNYGPGAHTYDYWVDDLRATLPAILAAAAQPRADPTTVEHVAYEPRFSVWGFEVALERTVLEATVLTVRPDGFSLRGSSRGAVTTPVRFAPGERVHATGTSSTGDVFDTLLTADANGRVVVPVDLGPANTVDEYPVGVLVRREATVDVTLMPDGDGAGVAGVPGDVGASGSARALPATGGATPLWIIELLLALSLIALRARRRKDGSECS